jgi:hypothetical protein
MGVSGSLAAFVAHLGAMCRNIRPLFNFEPPATDAEIEAAALQFVRKVSGSTRPSAKNQAHFDDAVEQISRITRTLIDSLETSASPRDRVEEAQKARARAAKRYGTLPEKTPSAGE